MLVRHVQQKPEPLIQVSFMMPIEGVCASELVHKEPHEMEVDLNSYYREYCKVPEQSKPASKKRKLTSTATTATI